MPAEPLKMNYPSIVAAKAPVIPAGATQAERQHIEDADAIAALLMFLERRGGWSFDPAADTLRCRCGGLGFEVELIEPAVTP